MKFQLQVDSKCFIGVIPNVAQDVPILQNDLWFIVRPGGQGRHLGRWRGGGSRCQAVWLRNWKKASVVCLIF